MRNFEYYLFENFDPDEESDNPSNPRNFLNANMDSVLSGVIDHAGRLDEASIHQLLDGGILRLDDGKLVFDCPVFLREDAAVLSREVVVQASALTDLLEKCLPDIFNCCAKIQNDFSDKLNLYHILCGMIFDGKFFDFLSNKGSLATSRVHPSGLDYLTVIYEKCPELQTFSNNLLCSYNRFVNDLCALQSFGDANGNRFDFYRFFRLLEAGKLPPDFKQAERLWKLGNLNKNSLLSETVTLIKTGHCCAEALSLLEVFGYTENVKISVPVYTPEHQNVFDEMENIVEYALGDAISQSLYELSGSLQITPVMHGVHWLEIANELYHILFGTINQQLVDRQIVAEPQFFLGQGRYNKCIELYV